MQAKSGSGDIVGSAKSAAGEASGAAKGAAQKVRSWLSGPCSASWSQAFTWVRAESAVLPSGLHILFPGWAT